jgi:DivIVA domain-containing protein
VSSTFPRARKGRGYDTAEVEDFLEDARRAYQSPAGQAPGLTAEAIRTTAFSMRRGGYDPSAVDAALERLEDAFATRERQASISRIGDQAWYLEARSVAQTILDRITRPRGRRFRRHSWFVTGYSVRETDAFVDRVRRYFQTGAPLTVGDIRQVAFRAQRGGYDEAQVDAVLDAVVDVMLAVRQD